MIEQPSGIALKDFNAYADWIELCALIDPDGVVSASDIQRVLGEEESFKDMDDMPEEDTKSSLVEQIWGFLKDRAVYLPTYYPFTIEGDLIKRNIPSWNEIPSFTAMLLISNIARFDKEIIVERQGSLSFRQLFEKLVQAAKKGLFKGACARFGNPREPSWPTSIQKRIGQFGKEMRLDVEILTGKVEADDKDRTLDVAARLSFGDDGPGSVVFLTQCATGRHWRDGKRHEPVLEMWKDILVWNAQLLRVLAIPLWIGEAKEYSRCFRHFGGAIILDRPRLLAGTPDQFLDQQYEQLITSWCREQINKLPVLN